MNQELEVLKFLQAAPLESLGPIMDVLAQRFFQYRMENNGFVPESVFEASLGIGGAHPCVEIMVQVADYPSGYALKKRGGNELGWRDFYHIPGATASGTDTVETTFVRAAREIYIDRYPPFITDDYEFLGVLTYSVTERHNTYWTLVFLHTVASLDHLDGEWKIFEDFDDQDIINYHRKTLKWAEQSLPIPNFANLGGFGEF